MTDPDFEQPNKLTDVCDIASEQEMIFAANALRATQSKVAQDQLPDSDGAYAILECVECDQEIGLGRLKVAPRNKLCVFCAARNERVQR